MSTRIACLAAALALGTLPAAGCFKKGPGAAGHLDPNSAEGAFHAGVRALEPDRRGDIDLEGAYAHFRRAGEEHSAGPRAWFNAGYVADQLGREADAESHYRQAWQLDPGYDPAFYALLEHIHSRGAHGEAASLLESRRTDAPDDISLVLAHAEALVRAGDSDRALTEARTVLLQHPDHAEAHRTLSRIHVGRGEFELGRMLAEKALKLEPSSPDIHNDLGILDLETGDEVAAVGRFKKAREIDPSHFAANMNLGLIALRSGDYELAVTCLEAAHKAQSPREDTRIALAIARRGAGDFDGAEAIYQQLVDEGTRREAAYFNAATLHEKYTGDFTKALNYLDSYRRLDGDDSVASGDLANRIARVEATQQEVEAAKRAEAERRRKEAERRKRNEELLASMASIITDTRTRIDVAADCLPAEFIEEMEMYLENAEAVVASEDVDMASDVQSLLTDFALPALDEATAAHCGTGAPSETDEAADATP